MMTGSIFIGIPHNLGRPTTRERLENSLSQITGMIPGGSLISNRWEGDKLYFEVEAMGQRVAAELEVLDDVVDMVDLPPLVTMFDNRIKTKLGQVRAKMLE